MSILVTTVSVLASIAMPTTQDLPRLEERPRDSNTHFALDPASCAGMPDSGAGLVVMRGLDYLSVDGEVFSAIALVERGESSMVIEGTSATTGERVRLRMERTDAGHYLTDLRDGTRTGPYAACPEEMPEEEAPPPPPEGLTVPIGDPEPLGPPDADREPSTVAPRTETAPVLRSEPSQVARRNVDVPYSYRPLGGGEAKEEMEPFAGKSFGVSREACRGETDGIGLVRFDAGGMEIDGAYGALENSTASGNTFLTGTWNFGGTMRELRFSIVGGRRLGLRETVDRQTRQLGRYILCG